MKIQALTITLSELRDALQDYAAKHGIEQPEVVYVESYNKVVMQVGMGPGENITGAEFNHRAD